MATITWRPGWPPIYGMMTADDGEPYDLTGATVSLSVQVGATAGGLVTIYSNNDWDRVPFNFIVPPGHFYRFNTGNTIWHWSELS